MSRRSRILSLLIAVVAAWSLVSCTSSGGSMTAGKGQLRIRVASGGVTAASSSGAGSTTLAGSRLAGSPVTNSDQPDVSLQSANATFSSILARNLDGQLIDVTIALPTTVDLLSLGGGNAVTLPVGFLPPGTYDQLVVVVTQLDLVLQDGTKISVTPPGGGWTAIVNVAAPFTVVEGQTTSVTIQFRRDLSFGFGTDGWEFHPRFDCSGGHSGGEQDD